MASANRPGIRRLGNRSLLCSEESNEKEKTKRPVPAWTTYPPYYYRKVIETTGSLIEQLLPKHVHAVTARGFELMFALFWLLS